MVDATRDAISGVDENAGGAPAPDDSDIELTDEELDLVVGGLDRVWMPDEQGLPGVPALDPAEGGTRTV